jgi:hypothetical protein
VYVDIRGLDTLVSHPQRDHGDVDARLKQRHRRTMPNDTRRHALFLKSGATGLIQVGVNSVCSRDQRYRRSLRQGLFNNPPLLFQRPVPPLVCARFRVCVHLCSKWTLSLVSTSRA